MNKIKVLFEQDTSLDCVEVTVKSAERDEQIDELIAKIGGSLQQMTVSDENGVLKNISTDEIFIISVNGKKLNIITESDSYSVRGSLQSIESSLDARDFIRISRYELINISKVNRYDFTLKGTLRIEFKNGIEAWASRRCIPNIRKMLSGKG
ncbi:MAG: LytTR family transcriptional regulator DNA-binding domain-containing protein [Ruminococcus sp.]|nr:LytTR family transcriptional regulator DNA-binding domain-containing protein [Ruminococcus sp.]